MQDKKVRISVEDAKLKDLKRYSQEMAADMIRQSRQYSSSAKEVLKDLEAQIKAVEKRNNLEKEAQTTKIRTGYQAGTIDKAGFKIGMDAAGLESQQNKLTVSLLREIIESIKATSKDEIREDRATVEKTIRRDRNVNRLGVTGDPQLALRRTLQQDMLGELGEEEQGQKQRFRAFGRYGRGAGAAFNTAAGLGTSKNEMYALAGLVGLTPVIGAGLSAVSNRLLSAGETAETAMTAYGTANMAYRSRRAGDKRGEYSKSAYEVSKENWTAMKGWSADLGMDPSQTLGRRADLMRSMGTKIGIGDFRGLMGAEKFVGAGAINQLAGVSRYGQGDTMSVLRVLEGNQRNVTRLTENISAYVQASNAALNISSNVNESAMARNIMGISKATGQSGIGLNQVTGAIQGMGNTSNPIVRSLLMRSFRQMNPGSSLFDIQAMMEDPLANLQRGGGKFFENIKGMTGGGEMYKQVLHTVFGGQLSKTRINEILKGGGDFTQIAKEAQITKESAFEFERRAGDTVGAGAKATAEANTFFQDWGQETLLKTKETVDELKKAYDSGREMYEVLEGIKEGMDKVVDVANDAVKPASNVALVLQGKIILLLEKLLKDRDTPYNPNSP